MKQEYKKHIIKITCSECKIEKTIIEKVKKTSVNICEDCGSTHFITRYKLGYGVECSECEGKGTYIDLFSKDEKEIICTCCNGFGIN